MFVEEIGEFGLIRRIFDVLQNGKDRLKQGAKLAQDVAVGLGDDAAVVKVSSENYLVLTCDLLVEDVHFKIGAISAWELGYKSIATNVSDVAAMAGIPRFALISLALKSRTPVEFVEDLYRGMKDAASQYGALIIGGDTSTSSVMTIGVALVGEVEPQMYRTRDSARVGDLIFVTGELGASAAGLHLLLDPNLSKELSLSPDVLSELRRAHLEPTARVREARLASELGAHAMEDVSDGLCAEVRHICEMSKVGAAIWSSNIPVARGVMEVAEKLGKDGLSLALSGGEDYELVFTAPAEQRELLISRIFEETGTKVSVVGEVLPPSKGIVLVDSSGAERKISDWGYEHFA